MALPLQNVWVSISHTLVLTLASIMNISYVTGCFGWFQNEFDCLRNKVECCVCSTQFIS